jgi:uncharacterized protein (TIGR00251 family)
MTRLRVHVVPNAKINKVVGEHGGAIKIKLRAPAVEGKANSALISFLADELNISQRAIVTEQGLRSRDKLIRITGLTEEDVRSGLLGTSGKASTANR